MNTKLTNSTLYDHSNTEREHHHQHDRYGEEHDADDDDHFHRGFGPSPFVSSIFTRISKGIVNSSFVTCSGRVSVENAQASSPVTLFRWTSLSALFFSEATARTPR